MEPTLLLLSRDLRPEETEGFVSQGQNNLIFLGKLIYSKLFECIQNYLKTFKSIRTYSDVFETIHI